MPFSITTHAGRQLLTLEESVTVRDASELAALVTASLDEAMPLEVETGQLSDIDTCILQFLFSLHKTVPELTFAAPSFILLGALDRAQLRRSLLGGRETP